MTMSGRQKPEQSGRATLADWKAFLAKNGPVDYLDAVFIDICGTVRGKRLPVSEAEKVFTSGLQMPRSIYFLDVTGVNEDIHGMGFSDGDPDCNAWPVAGTLQLVPWAEQPHAQVFMTMVEDDGTPCGLEPRNVLRQVLARFEEKGWHPVVAAEFEFYLLDTQMDEDGCPQPPINPATGEREFANELYGILELDGFGALLNDISDYADIQGVPATAATAEFAPGQYEINLRHEKDPLAAADHAVMLRHLIMAAARRHGFYASFMAKPYMDQTGNGCHMHVSLLDDDGNNLFDDGGEEGSDALRNAIGGLQALLDQSMAILAPNLNAHRRFGPNLFVPVNAAWGYNNRSVAFRVPAGEPENRRIEHRVAGADINPYLALAAILAGIHYGLENKLDPGMPAEGNACEQMDDNLPFFVPSALKRMRNSKVLRDYFSDAYVDVYTEVKLLEYEKFQRRISALEYEWYL